MDGQPRRRPGHDGADVPAAERADGCPRAGAAHRRHGCPVLGRRAHLSRRLGGSATRWDKHAHAGRRRHHRSVRLQRLRNPVAASSPAMGFSQPSLLRNGGHHHRFDPDGPLAGSAGQEADGRRHQSIDGSTGEDRPCHP